MAKQHETIPFDPAAYIKRSLKNQAFKAAYDALEDEFSALDALLQAGTQTSRPDSSRSSRAYGHRPIRTGTYRKLSGQPQTFALSRHSAPLRRCVREKTHHCYRIIPRRFCSRTSTHSGSRLVWTSCRLYAAPHGGVSIERGQIK